MFTGIITAKGRIRSLKEQGGDLRMVIESHGLRWSEFSIGESISVNGICLTIAALHNDGFEADVSVETMKVTTFDGLNTGSMLNHEPSIRLSDRLGGHLVSGHVDCVGTIINIYSFDFGHYIYIYIQIKIMIYATYQIYI